MTKHKLDLYYVKTNSYTKVQVNISKDGREKFGKLNLSKVLKTKFGKLNLSKVRKTKF